MRQRKARRARCPGSSEQVMFPGTGAHSLEWGRKVVNHRRGNEMTWVTEVRAVSYSLCLWWGKYRWQWAVEHTNLAVEAICCGQTFTSGEKYGLKEGCSKLRDIRTCLYLSGNYPVGGEIEIVINYST